MIPFVHRLATAILLLSVPSLAMAESDDAALAELRRLSELVAIQAKVYGIEDRCLKTKLPELELRTLLIKTRAAGATATMIELIDASYSDGIKYAANIDCRLAPVILRDLAVRHASLSALPQPPK